MRRLIDRDPLTGQEIWYDFDNSSQKATIGYLQDVDRIIEANKCDINDDDRTAAGIKRDWWHYARVPNTVILKWRVEHGVDFWNPNHRKRVFELLNDPEYKFLRATHKHHAEK